MRKLALALGAALLSAAGFAQIGGKHTFQVAEGQFRLDGKPFQILSGEMHPSRIPSAYWRHRIRMAKAMGLNTIAPYIFWNVHEPEKGRFNFEGEANIAKFIQICQEEGMWVLLRPGPYVCAEWEFGGYPYWLQREKSLTVRADNAPFLRYTQRYLKELARQTGKQQITHGGNILMVQVENEYGSYGSDKTYMTKCLAQVRQAGFDVPLYVAEGGSQLASAWIPGVVAGVNGGSGPGLKTTVDKYTPGGPYFVPEFYPGWLDHWGESFVKTNGGVKEYDWLIRNDYSVNLYMFHGGTNFGFTNGANYSDHFEPHITSYDYDAPLDEAGRPTPKYMRFREALGSRLPIPASNPVVTIPPFSLKRVGPLDAELPQPVRAKTPLTFEALGQDYGFVLYRHRFAAPTSGTLTLRDLRDYAVVKIDGVTVGHLDRRIKQSSLEISVPRAGSRLDILVENMGRINYGSQIPNNLKGITEAVSLNGDNLVGWEMYRLPMRTPPTQGSYKGSFQLRNVGDAFLDLRNWSKGVVWVNGHNLGRYWNIGPQQTLYVPGPWLRKGKNEVTVFEELEPKKAVIQGLTEPVLTDLRRDLDVRPNARKRGAVAPWSFEAPVLTAELLKKDGEQRFNLGNQTGRYVGLETLSSYPDDDFASLAELNLYDANGKALNRAKWSIAYVESEETAQEDGRAENILDGDLETIWHSAWSVEHTKNPHRILIDLGSEARFSAVGLAPRLGDRPAKLKGFRVFCHSY